MTDETNDAEVKQEDPVGMKNETEDLSIVEKIAGVYISPAATFRQLSKKPDFWMALIVVSLVLIAVGMLAAPKIIPAQQALSAEMLPEFLADRGVPEEEIQQAVEMQVKGIPNGVYLGTIVGIPIMLAISWLILTVLAFFISLVQGLNTDFKRLLWVLPWIGLVSMLTEVVSGIVKMTADLSDPSKLNDLAFIRPLSLANVVPGSSDMPMFLQALLASIDPFFIWAAVLMVIALEAANTCSRAKAITTTVIVQVILLAAGAALAHVGNMIMGG